MKNLEKWLKSQGYKFRRVTFYNVDGTDKSGYMIDTDYEGLYPGKEQFDALSSIRSYVRKYYKDMEVEPRGYYTAVAIR